MEYLHNGFTLDICPEGFPLSTDTVALSGFVKLPRQAQVLDLGSGCGSLGLLLCARQADCAVTGIEIEENAHLCALKNARDNGITDRLTSIWADLKAIDTLVKPGSFHCCVSNPPYYSAGPHSSRTPLARREDRCSLEDLVKAAAWALKYGGDFFIVHKPERLAQLCACASHHRLEPKQLCLLRHKPDDPVSLILLQCRKGGKPGLAWHEESLFDREGQPTAYYRSIYHLQGG